MRPVLTLGGLALALLALALLALGSSCEWQAQEECHRDAVERFGCCPTCSAECRAAVTEACADIHDTPLTDEDIGGSSEGGDEPSDDREPMPIPQ